jgi:hypothetical protein
MKKILILTAFIFISAGVYSQTIGYGIDAGLNITKVPMTLGKPQYNNSQAGFHAGGFVDIKFGSFSFQPGLSFTVKGGATKPDSAEVSTGISTPAVGTTHLLIDYIEIPLNFFYRIKTDNGNIFLGGGPYFALGVHASNEFHGTYAGGSVNQENVVEFGSNYPGINSKDFGINGIVGARVKNIYISAGYGKSLVNISVINNNVKNQGYSFSLGYFIK